MRKKGILLLVLVVVFAGIGFFPGAFCSTTLGTFICMYAFAAIPVSVMRTRGTLRRLNATRAYTLVNFGAPDAYGNYLHGVFLDNILKIIFQYLMSLIMLIPYIIIAIIAIIQNKPY